MLNDIFSLLISTIKLRPYVFIFLGLYLIIATSQIGLKRTFLFTIIAYTIAFLSEYSSTRTGFPYGYYSYIETTRGKELWIANVPFMDSLSYTFLSYISYSTAILIGSPIIKNKTLDIQLADTYKIRHSFSVLTISALLIVLLDIVIDPVALRGSRWFLGQIYTYPEYGLYFGVPLSNFFGWIVVGFAIILVFQMIDRLLIRSGNYRDIGMIYAPFKGILGPILYLIVLCFNLIITFAIREYILGLYDLFILSVITAILVWKITTKKNRATKKDIAAHLNDFPKSFSGFAQTEINRRLTQTNAD